MKKIVSFFNNSKNKIFIKPSEIKINTKQAKAIINTLINLIKPHYPNLQKLNNNEVLNFLTDKKQLSSRSTPRLEIHKSVSGEVLCFNLGVNPEIREAIYLKLKEDFKNYSIKKAGATIIELSLQGINKGVVVNYFNSNFDKILDLIKYKTERHFMIDARKNKTAIFADADGTIYGEPLKENPEAFTKNHLGNSAAKEAIQEYLKAGGILVICTGADYRTTSLRLLKGLPEELRSRVILTAASGSCLNYFKKDGTVQEYPLYRKEALQVPAKPITIDAIFMGDDARAAGNDYPGFSSIGFDRAVVVTGLPKEKVPETLKPNLVGRNEKGTGLFLEQALKFAAKSPKEKLFTPEQIKNFIKALPVAEANPKTKKLDF